MYVINGRLVTRTSLQTSSTFSVSSKQIKSSWFKTTRTRRYCVNGAGGHRLGLLPTKSRYRVWRMIFSRTPKPSLDMLLVIFTIVWAMIFSRTPKPSLDMLLVIFTIVWAGSGHSRRQRQSLSTPDFVDFLLQISLLNPNKTSVTSSTTVVILLLLVHHYVQ